MIASTLAQNSTFNSTLATEWRNWTRAISTPSVATATQFVMIEATSASPDNATNVTDPGDEEVYREPYSQGLIILLAVLTSTITMTAIVGNTLILSAFFTTPRLRRLTTYFYASLAVSDLAAGVLVMPFMMSFTLTASWNFGKAFCKIWLCIDMFVYSASVFHMCAICLDRFLAIRFPLRYMIKRTKKLILSFIAVAWGLALVTEVPVTIFYEHVVGESIVDYGAECDVEWVNNAAITIYSFVVTVVIPFFFMLILSTFIFVTIRRRRELSGGDKKNGKKRAKTRNSGDRDQNADQVPVVGKPPTKLNGFIDCFALPGRRKSYNLSAEGVAKDTQEAVVSVKFEQKNDDFMTFVNRAFQIEDMRTSAMQNVKGERGLGRSAREFGAAARDENGPENPACGQVDCTNNGKESNSLDNDRTDAVCDENDNSNGAVPESESRDLRGVDVAKRKSVSYSDDVNRRSSQSARRSLSSTQQKSNERRAVITMSILIGVFLLTWLPWKLTTIADAIAEKYLFPELWYDLAIWLQYSNSMINPFLYVLRENDFKIAIKRILCRVFCCKKIKSPSNYRKSSSSSALSVLYR